jgi:beta-galactosidase
VTVEDGKKQAVKSSVKINRPRLWGPVPAQQPNLYVAVTRLIAGKDVIDTYETTFGIRTVVLDGTKGLSVNGEKVMIQGINNHHDLGAIGAAFNVRAAERRLEQLRELGCNTIRMSHNPPAPELLDLTDRMGFLVLDEIFDSWEVGKTPSDFFLIFPDWHEQDLRSFVRRDRNHPSIFGWSYGNEVGEQYTEEAGAAISQMLKDIVHEEDPTRLSTASENYATPEMPFPRIVDFLSINYQGAGIRDTEAYAGLTGINTKPLYPAYHAKFPNKMIVGSETASTVSTRGTYVFPVTGYNSAPVNDTSGGDPVGQKVSAYELYTAGFGSSPDKVFAADDQNPFVAGEMVWTGVDYLGEPTPYYSARSSYSGIIDLAGFKKDRFYLYQSRWRPDLRIAHILPHWNWPERVGLVTPVHVFTAGDEAELFLNGKSQGRKKRAVGEYRFRWDEVVYQPGELHVVTYKKGKEWARDAVRTTGAAAALKVTADRTAIKNDGLDLSFITVEVVDRKGDFVAQADTSITFSISGPGEIVATDNGDPADMVSFSSKERKAYSGLALAIVRFKPGKKAAGPITVTASADGLVRGKVTLIGHP